MNWICQEITRRGALALLALPVVCAAQASDYLETADLNSFGDMGNNETKFAIAMDGNLIAVRHVFLFEFSGDPVVQIYTANDGVWGVTDVFVDPDPTNQSAISAFGAHLSLDGDTLAIAQASTNNGAGVVYVHVRDSFGSWSLEQTLSAADAAPNAGFGAAVLDGDRILVGAAFDSTQVQQGGAAYIFERSGGVWTQTAKLQPSVPIVGDRLGREVDLVGDLAVLNSKSGATVFRNTLGVWTEEAKLTHTAPISRSVSTDGTTIGLAEDENTRIALFEQVAGQWTSIGTVSTDTLFPNRCRIVIDDGLAMISSNVANLPSEIGAWIAERTPTGWPLTAEPLRARPLGATTSSILSRSVDRIAASDGRIASLSSVRQSGPLEQRGTVLIHERVESPPVEFCFGSEPLNGCATCPCGNDSPPEEFAGCLSASGTAPRLIVGGVPQVSKDTLRFQLRFAEPSSFALLVSGDRQLPAQGPCPVGSGILGTPALDGLRCVGMNLLRHGTRALNAQGFTPTLWGVSDPTPGQGLIVQNSFAAGQTRHWQSFFRQPPGAVCTAGIGTSQGISVTFAP